MSQQAIEANGVAIDRIPPQFTEERRPDALHLRGGAMKSLRRLLIHPIWIVPFVFVTGGPTLPIESSVGARPRPGIISASSLTVSLGAPSRSVQGMGGACLEGSESFDSIETAHDVVAVDVNEDSHLDLVVLGHLPLAPERGLVILLGDGQGGFVPFVALPIGDHNHGVIAADLNRDGHIDLALSTADRDDARFEINVLHTFLGDGTGRFPVHNLWKVERDQLGPLDVQAADLNHDGNPDLIAAGAGLGHVAVLLGNGRGGFGPPTFFSNRLTRTRTTVIADFSEDGNLDVIVSNRYGNSLSLLVGDGKGNLEQVRSFPTGIGPRTLITTDLNRDGRLDVAVTTRESDGISVLFGVGQGSFTPSLNIKTGRDPRTIRAADFDGDGFVDLAVVNSLSQTLVVLAGNRRGTFSMTTEMRIGKAPDRGRFRDDPKEPGVGAGLVGLDVGDVDEDGVLDLIVSSTFDGNVYLLLNRCQKAQP